MKTAEKIIENFTVNVLDTARLIQEAAEELGERAKGLERDELIRLLRRVLRSGISALKQEEHTVSFEEAAWASVAERTGRRAATLRDLRHFVRRMLRVEGVAQCPLRSMSTRQCRHLLDTAFGGSAHSYTKGRAVLHSIFAYGLRQEWCSENPVKRIGMPRLNEKEIIPLTPAEIRRLQQTAQQPQHREMLFSLHLMVYGGVRPTEVSRLTEDCIQLDRNRVIIPPSGSKTGDGRVIPLLRKQLLQGVSPSIPRNWQKRWRALRRDAGFSSGQWQPDVCRHTFASYHAAYFRNLPELQLIMGHRSTDLLRTRYLNLPTVQHARRFWVLT